MTFHSSRTLPKSSGIAMGTNASVIGIEKFRRVVWFWFSIFNYVLGAVHMSSVPVEAKRGRWIPLALEPQVIVSQQTWVLERKLGFSARAASAPSSPV